MLSSIFLLLIIAVCLICLWKVRKDSKLELTSRDFFLHGEELPFKGLVATLVSTNLSLGNMVFVCGMMGYFYGWSGVFWVVLTIVFLGIGFILFGNSFKDYIEEKGNYGTIHDYISRHHDTSSNSSFFTSKISAATTSILSLFVAIIIEIHIGTMVISHIFSISQTALVICVLFGIALYAVVSGFKTVVFTDILQFFCMLFAIIAAMVLFIKLPGSKTFTEVGYNFSFVNMFSDTGFPTALGFIVLGFFWLISTPDTWQRNCASRSLNTTMKASIAGTFLMCIFVACFGIGGMLVKSNIEPIIPDFNTSSLSKGYFAFSDIFLVNYNSMGIFINALLAFIGLGLLMAAVSTVDTFMVVIGHTLNVDLGFSLKNIKSFSEIEEYSLDKSLLFRGRVFIILSSFLLFAGWGIMHYYGLLSDPLSLFFVTYTIQFCLAIPVITARYSSLQGRKTTSLVILFSAILTLVLGLYGMINLNSEELLFNITPSTWLAILPVIPLIVGILGYSSLYIANYFKVIAK